MFRQANAFEARVEGNVLLVPLVVERAVPNWLPFEKAVFRAVRSFRRPVARFDLSKLSTISYDYNDVASWFDITGQSGQVLRLLFSKGPRTPAETSVLEALRKHADHRTLWSDAEMRAALERA